MHFAKRCSFFAYFSALRIKDRFNPRQIQLVVVLVVRSRTTTTTSYTTSTSTAMPMVLVSHFGERLPN